MLVDKKILKNPQKIDISNVKKAPVFYRFTKRVFDIVFSAIGIVITFPFCLILSIFVMISTKSLPLFPDKRVGKKGKDIYIYKFRTMYKDSESNIKKYLNKEQIKMWNCERKVPNDPRVTRFGKILRRTSIDEIPQLLNIFIGNMSFVGPRPITRMEMDKNFTPEEQNLLYSGRPGLTGLWQVCGRTEETWMSGRRKMFDLIYFVKRSFIYDTKIFLLTIPSCFGFALKSK